MYTNKKRKESKKEIKTPIRKVNYAKKEKKSFLQRRYRKDQNCEISHELTQGRISYIYF